MPAGGGHPAGLLDRDRAGRFGVLRSGRTSAFTDLLDGALWKGMGAVAAVLAICRPVAKPAEQVRSLEARVTRYKALAFNLRKLIHEIEDRQRSGDPEREQLRRLLRKLNDVARAASTGASCPGTRRGPGGVIRGIPWAWPEPRRWRTFRRDSALRSALHAT